MEPDIPFTHTSRVPYNLKTENIYKGVTGYLHSALDLVCLEFDLGTSGTGMLSQKETDFMTDWNRNSSPQRQELLIGLKRARVMCLLSLILLLSFAYSPPLSLPSPCHLSLSSPYSPESISSSSSCLFGNAAWCFAFHWICTH